MEDEDGSDNAARTADSQPQAMVVPLPEEGEEERIRRILERGLNVHDGRIFKMQHSSFPLPGTTFPQNSDPSLTCFLRRKISLWTRAVWKTTRKTCLCWRPTLQMTFATAICFSTLTSGRRSQLKLKMLNTSSIKTTESVLEWARLDLF